MSRYFIFILIVVGVLFFSCEKNTHLPTSPVDSQGSSSVSFFFQKPPGIDSLVVFAKAVVSAPDMDSIFADLTVTPTQVEGTIEDIPAGPHRKFEIFTYDADTNLTYYGHEFADVIAGQTITIQIILYPVNTTGTVIIVGTFAPFPPPGGFLNAIEFDGIDDYAQMLNLVITSTTFTIEAWAKMKGPGGGFRNQNPIFQQRSDQGAQTNNVSTIIFDAEGTYNQTALGLRSTVGPFQQIDVIRPNYNEWHHFAVVVGQSEIRIYIDGVLMGSEQNSQAGNYTSYIDYVEIGRHRYGNMNAGFFNGLIDELRIWNYERSQAKIQSKMNVVLGEEYYTTPDSGLIGYWRFDILEDLGVNGDGVDDIRDFSVYGNHADLHGDPVIVPHME